VGFGPGQDIYAQIKAVSLVAPNERRPTSTIAHSPWDRRPPPVDSQ
jgi:hypothetical protein